jgi:light-independent protochlorophyllide reductase subunit B
MFRGDFEFHEDAAPSHLGRPAPPRAEPPAAAADSPAPAAASADAAPATASIPDAVGVATWTADAERELKKIPFFVRGKAKRNTERFALERGLTTITIDTLYDAKAHFSQR